MPSVKISQLPSITTTSGGEVILAVQNGISKKVTLASLFNGIKSSTDFKFDVQSASFKISNDVTDILTAIGGTTNKIGVLTNTPDVDFHVYGSTKIGKAATYAATTADVSADKPAINITPYELIGSQSATTTITASCDTTAIVVESDRIFTLSDGTNGQSKTVILTNIVGTGKATVTSANSQGWTSFVLSNVGASISLKFIGGKWFVVGSYLAAISTE